ncbi:hypothetical protein C0989_010301 [Termitomyces sp. Mn162]|nr:hypothetical protein C0989_010301 [Termitomyces sp. Mn162]
MSILARVYIIRHGETQENRDGVIQGQLDTALNNVGLEQARIVGEKLRSIPFEIAFSSDLNRAVQVRRLLQYDFPCADMVCTDCRSNFGKPSRGQTAEESGTARTGVSCSLFELLLDAARPSSWVSCKARHKQQNFKLQLWSRQWNQELSSQLGLRPGG